jgi:hypothetical protein
MIQGNTEKIITEAKRIEEDAEFSGKGHLNAARLWAKIHYIIGVPMTFSAALSGIFSINENPQWAAIFALLASTLGGLQTFINPEQKASSHKTSGNGFKELGNKVRIFREIELPQMDLQKTVENIVRFDGERNQLNQTSLSIPRCAWWRAKKDIESGFSTYRVDCR